MPACGRSSRLPGLEEALNPKGELRTLPSMRADMGGMDGFFAAAFVKSP